MALFQPTFVTPDASWGIGNGTVDLTDGLTVSWQVNGNSAMVAYQIDFYANDAASTLKHSTGKVTLSTPYYGVNPKGDPNPFFSVDFTAADLSSWSMTNGNEYKIVIKQWWDADNSVTQTSASAFSAKAKPTLSFVNAPTHVTTKDHTFTLSYSQAQGDALNWVRYTLEIQDASSVSWDIVYDSQNIYGTADLQFSYNGFFAGRNYRVTAEIQTASGVEATATATFDVVYATSTMEGYVLADRACRASAVHVYWPDLFTTTATADGPYTLSGGKLYLPEGTNIIWDKRDGQSFVYSTPWGVAFKGTMTAKDATLFKLNFTDSTSMTLQFDAADREIVLKNGSSTLETVANINGYATLKVVVTATDMYVRSDYLSGGLYPMEETSPGVGGLYPNTSLYPIADTIPSTTTNDYTISYTQKAIASVEMDGDFIADYLLISRGALSQEVIDSIMDDPNYYPPAGGQNNFYATFDDSLDAGTLSLGGDDVVGYDVYRKAEGDATLKYIANIGVGDAGIFDYGAQSEQGPYVYYVYPIGENTYITDPIISDSVNPCFWDWTLLECEEDESIANIYHVKQAFNFGKNLASGSISNGATPSQFQTFTKYPLIQPSTALFQSGTLSSLIGIIDYDDEHNGYYDTKAMRDAIWNLSQSRKPKFLKSRKGDLLMVEINGEIVMETMDESRTQAQTVQLPWAEVGDASECSVVSTALV